MVVEDSSCCRSILPTFHMVEIFTGAMAFGANGRNLLPCLSANMENDANRHLLVPLKVSTTPSQYQNEKMTPAADG
ncbi:hypothetical protein CEXT_603691 [Caerostris extrusa]|uniref:Uncharacterized protein n=1 Tax=Caerostris extrusa TaxID=172846 RepID=A0AAV4NVT0_CAEEX|nr:hypothetical protein CEXT_603691 [Caerostris extrusa]